VLLGVTGGIAAYKAAHLTRLLIRAGAGVQAVMTPASLRFLGADTLAALTGSPVRSDVFEEAESVLHVRMAREADIAVVAPATANVLAKLALGLADDLLTSTLLELSGPLVVAPAMHTGMLENPATQSNLRVLQERGVIVVGPAAGALAAGDDGTGRMSEPEEILAAMEHLLAAGRDLAGRRVLVTAGPTHEPIDPVRFIGNRSSGRMGYAVAAEAVARGAEVVLISGPVALDPPRGARVVPVETAAEMREAVLTELPGTDAVVKAAAVADWRVPSAAPEKLKKEAGAPALDLVPTPDILAELARRDPHPFLVGFAAETEDLERHGVRKLEEKGLDLLVVNRVGGVGTGFGSETNDAMLMSKTGGADPPRRWTKRDLAVEICDRLAKLLAG
jgi:phosphopantothenoylcysteine decarboxylase/phosphopantothenate--cysteine ligase